MLPEELVPLFVDLDGTVVKTDLLWESVLVLLRQNVCQIIAVVAWLTLGRARLKAAVARRAELDTDALPLHPDFVRYLQTESARGRPIYLASASDRSLAEAVARRIGIFAGVLASDGQRNLKGREKLQAILAAASPSAFDYAGNAWADLPIWKRARRRIVVNPSWGIGAIARQQFLIERVFDDRPPALRLWLRQLRLYQWLKNVLLGVPLLTAHVFDVSSLRAVAIAFLAFGCVASAGYVLNDLVDLPSDRRHPRKCKRPLAAGDLPLSSAVIASFVLLAAGIALAAFQSFGLVVVLVTYWLLSLGYSFYLKRLVLIDVIVLSMLYTARIVAGALIIEAPLSSWLLAFSLFIFLSLALLKRSSELITVEGMSCPAASGRDYRVSDQAIVTMMGVSCGYLAVVVLALFVDSPQAHAAYAHVGLLWLLCPLLFYWVSRLWIKTDRGEMNDDPLLFSLRDRPSAVLLASVGLITILAI